MKRNRFWDNTVFCLTVFVAVGIATLGAASARVALAALTNDLYIVFNYVQDVCGPWRLCHMVLVVAIISLPLPRFIKKIMGQQNCWRWWDKPASILQVAVKLFLLLEAAEFSVAYVETIIFGLGLNGIRTWLGFQPVGAVNLVSWFANFSLVQEAFRALIMTSFIMIISRIRWEMIMEKENQLIMKRYRKLHDELEEAGLLPPSNRRKR